MSLSALKELGELEAEIATLVAKCDALALAKKKEFAVKITDAFVAYLKKNDLVPQLTHNGARAKIGNADISLVCSDPSENFFGAYAKYSVTCSLAPTKSYDIMLTRDVAHLGGTVTVTIVAQTDQLTAKRKTVSELRSLIEDNRPDQWKLVGTLKDTKEVPGAPRSGAAPQRKELAGIDEALEEAFEIITKISINPGK